MEIKNKFILKVKKNMCKIRDWFKNEEEIRY